MKPVCAPDSADPGPAPVAEAGSPGPGAAAPGADSRPGEVTRLLHALSAGDASALEQLTPLLYGELRNLARRQMRGESASHTLQPTALVHEAFLRLLGQREAAWQNRQHFLSVAAQVMRRVLVDHARRRRAGKRGGGASGVAISVAAGAISGSAGDPLDLIALDQALARLAELDSRQARIVELRYFGGLSVDETAHVLDLSPATVKRDWQFAKAWLVRELSG